MKSEGNVRRSLVPKVRFGEGERDNVISHGASAVLNERMYKSCDPFKTTVCRSCGSMAISDHVRKEYACRSCSSACPISSGGAAEGTGEGTFGTCSIPYSFKLLIQTLMAAGIRLGLSFDRPVERRARVREERKPGEDSDDEAEEEEEFDEEAAEVEEIAEMAEYYGTDE